MTIILRLLWNILQASNITVPTAYLPTVPIFTQEKVGKGAILPYVPIFAKICL